MEDDIQSFDGTSPRTVVLPTIPSNEEMSNPPTSPVLITAPRLSMKGLQASPGLGPATSPPVPRPSFHVNRADNVRTSNASRTSAASRASKAVSASKAANVSLQNAPATLRSLAEHQRAYTILCGLQAVCAFITAAVTVAQMEAIIDLNGVEDFENRECRLVQGTTQATLVCNLQPLFPWETGTGVVDGLRWTATVSSFGMAWALTAYYLRIWRVNHTDRHLSRPAFIQSHEFVRLLWDLLLFVPYVFPRCEEVLGADAYLYVLIFTVASLVRLVICARAWLQWSRLKHSTSLFVTRLSGVEVTYTFLAKQFINRHPWVSVAGIYSAMLVLSAYLLRLVESVSCLQQGFLDCTPITFPDAMWLLVITVTSIGYGGRYAPRSWLGRLITAIVALMGYLGTLLLISVVIMAFRMNRTELVIHGFMRRHGLLSKYQVCAARAIQAAWRFHKASNASLKWKRGILNIQYRELSQRLPLEVKFLTAVEQWSAQRRLIARLSTDADINYGWMVTSKLSVRINQIRPMISAIWDTVLPPHVRKRFDKHILGEHGRRASHVGRTSFSSATHPTKGPSTTAVPRPPAASSQSAFPLVMDIYTAISRANHLLDESEAALSATSNVLQRSKTAMQHHAD